MEGRDGINTEAWELVRGKKMNKRKRKGTNKGKRLPSKPDIPPQMDILIQNCLVSLQAN